MTDKFDDTIARIDRTSPSLAEALPGIVRLFKMHEDKFAEFDRRIEKTNVDFMKKLDGLADHLDESRHRLHGSINHTDGRATEALNGVKRVHERIDFLEDRMTGMEARVPKTSPVEVNVTADTESLTAYVHRLETLISDIEKGLSNRLDVHRTDINRLEQRISDCELAVGTDKLEHSVDQLGTTPPAVDPERFEKLETLFDDQRVKLWARIDHIDRYFTNRLYEVEQIAGSTSYDHSTTEYMQKELTERVERLERAAVFATEDPRPQRDTSWHPYDAKADVPPEDDKRVVVMSRAGYIARPDRADYRNWNENGNDTIIAWRYAKEGE